MCTFIENVRSHVEGSIFRIRHGMEPSFIYSLSPWNDLIFNLIKKSNFYKKNIKQKS